MRLLDVAERGDASQDPVVRVVLRLQQDERDVVEVRSRRLLVHRTLVQGRVLCRAALHSVHVHDWQRREQYLNKKTKGQQRGHWVEALKLAVVFVIMGES